MLKKSRCVLPRLALAGFVVMFLSICYPAAAAVPAPQEKARPLYYERAITKADLEGRTLRELSLMRNTIYARAGNKFRKKWLNDYFSALPWYHPLDQMDEKKLTALDRRNAEAIARYDAAITRADLLDRQAAFLNPQTAEDKIELRLIYMRLGKWAGGDDQERTALEDPSLLDKQLTLDNLKDFSRRDLRLLRNLVYARHGRPFKSDLLRAYFEAVEWYKADDKYSDALLTAVDRRNINLIRSLEDQLGGPLTDYDNKKEDGWFSRA
jgi:hypothetical protein